MLSDFNPFRWEEFRRDEDQPFNTKKALCGILVSCKNGQINNYSQDKMIVLRRLDELSRRAESGRQ